MVLIRAAQNSFILKYILRRRYSEFFVSNASTGTSAAINIFQKRNFYLTENRSILQKQEFARKQLRNMSNETGTSNSVKLNRLALEKSPYLLQHATNPIDWYPWGQEAFDKAKQENKLIFLSVGYSTCHWCHVMEKESFEDEKVAELMNKYYVNIKVDREERPDVDKVYMSFIQATVGRGGWPMSVFLTPDLQPIAGGTYFPPENRGGYPGFKTLLMKIAEKWNTDKSLILDSGNTFLDVLKQESENSQSSVRNTDIPGENAWKKCALQLSRSYEAEFGGFSPAPKFPQPSNFNFLFHMYSKDKHSECGKQCLEMCLYTLRKMAYGGIHDHVNKGFARYSVDSRWHVPHFEKMLYDQAQLAVSYCDAYVVTKDEFYADIVRDILTYVSRDLSHKDGGFYGAEDADSYPFEGAKHKQEGAFCVWEYDEIFNLLDEKTENISHADVIAYHYNVKKEGNVKPSQDPHGELLNKNVLACFDSYETTAEKFGISIELLKQILEKSHAVLYAERQKKPKPHKDTKILTSWNGLMISGFAKAGFVLKDQTYINRAVSAASFIKEHLYIGEDKSLLRCCYKGDDDQIVQISNPIHGFLEDYAFLIRGLLDLYEASLDSDWLQWAESLQEQQDKRFWDDENAGYFNSPLGDTSILIRGKDAQDGAEPCGNSVSVHNLIRLAAYLDRQDLKEKARKTLSSFHERLSSVPIALPEMTSALMLYHSSATQVFIAGQTEDNQTQALLDVVRSRFLPGRILALADGPGGRAGLLYRRHENFSKLRPVQGKPTAYVCRNFACCLPVTEPADLASSLDDSCKDEHKQSSE